MNRGLHAATDKMANIAHRVLEARYDESASGGNDIVVLPDALYVDSGWVFKDLRGLEYPKKFTDCDASELSEVASAFFYKIRELQQQLKAAELRINRLESEAAVLASPALQLIA
jgi:hypothetical protein